MATSINKHYDDEGLREVIGKVLSDGTIIEAVYDPASENGQLVVKSNGTLYNTDEYLDVVSGIRYRALIDPIIQSRSILLPTGYSEPQDALALIDAIKTFFRKYLDQERAVMELSARYVLMTWVFDTLPKVGYLRFYGMWGSGKSTALQTSGAICYHPQFLGASMSSPSLFRRVDRYGGTLIMDEADFENSGLNDGYHSMGFVSRVSMKNYKAEVYKVFGPKIMAARNRFGDDALESRIITCFQQATQNSSIRQVQRNKPWPEAEELRNRLLRFRLDNYHRLAEKTTRLKELEGFEPRIVEVLTPLFHATGEVNIPEPILQYIEKAQEDRIAVLRLGDEGIVAEELVKQSKLGNEYVYPGTIVEAVRNSTSISARKVGDILSGFGLEGKKVQKGFRYFLKPDRIEHLIRRYML